MKLHHIFESDSPTQYGLYYTHGRVRSALRNGTRIVSLHRKPGYLHVDEGLHEYCEYVLDVLRTRSQEPRNYNSHEAHVATGPHRITTTDDMVGLTCKVNSKRIGTVVGVVFNEERQCGVVVQFDKIEQSIIKKSKEVKSEPKWDNDVYEPSELEKAGQLAADNEIRRQAYEDSIRQAEQRQQKLSISRRTNYRAVIKKCVDCGAPVQCTPLKPADEVRCVLHAREHAHRAEKLGTIRRNTANKNIAIRKRDKSHLPLTKFEKQLTKDDLDV